MPQSFLIVLALSQHLLGTLKAPLMMGASWRGVRPIQELRGFSWVNSAARGGWSPRWFPEVCKRNHQLPVLEEGKSSLIQSSMTAPVPDAQNWHLEPFTSAKDPLSTSSLPAGPGEGLANCSPGFLNILFHLTFRFVIFFKTRTRAPTSFPHEDLLTPKRTCLYPLMRAQLRMYKMQLSPPSSNTA